MTTKPHTVTDGMLERAVGLLSSVVGFERLDRADLTDIAARFGVAQASPGTELITEGGPPAGFFIIVRGRVEVLQGQGSGTTLLNVLGPGAAFGQMSFVDNLGTADATVRAAEQVDYLMMTPDGFREVLRDHPDVGEVLKKDSLAILRANFLAHTATFRGLDADERRRLADAIEVHKAAAGAELVKQGEPGDACYLIATGKAEVLVGTEDGGRRHVAELGSGAVVGEGALLTDAPRTATVVMTEPGTVLRLGREALLDVVGEDKGLTTELVELLRMRWRPKQRPGVTVHERQTPEGETLVILKDERRGAYYRLAGDGHFIWDQLDGETTLRDIAFRYMEHFGRFDPERIARSVKGLVEAGFATAPGLREEVQLQQGTGRFTRRSLKAMKALSWRKAVDDVDGWFDTLHRYMGRWMFSRPGVVALIVVALGGIVATIAGFPREPGFLSRAGGPIILLALIPANAIGALLHEAAHGLVVKRYGRQVRKAGVGWFFISPIVFVDTSDMWLENRYRRALVSAAGPLMNLVVGGVAAFAAINASSPVVEALWWQAVIANYYLAVLNLNPMLEYDGYYILSDLLDRPNLREEALAWLGSGLPKALRNPRLFKGHLVDLLYGVIAALYMLVIVVVIVVVYRAFLQSLIDDVIPVAAAEVLAWALALTMAGLVVVALSAQLRGLNAPRH